MSKFLTTKYGTRINVEGLSPQQVARVRKVAEDSGAYGSRGAALAKQLQQRNSRQPAVGEPTPEADAAVEIALPTRTPDLGVNQQTGVINPNVAAPVLTGAEERDAQYNFNLNNPGQQTDIFGNTQSIAIDPQTGQVTKTAQAGGLGSAAQSFLTGALGQAQQGAQLDLSNELGQLQGARLDLSGAPQILQAGDVRGDAQAVADANFGFLTRNLQRDKGRELEETKQMLAERGIPIDYENPDSMWNKAVGSIEEKYQNLTDQANQQALMSRDASLQALTNVQGSARDAFLRSAGMEFDAATGQAKDSAALKGMQTGQVLNVLGAAGNVVGLTSPQFTQYQGGQIDQSSLIAGLLGLTSEAAQGNRALSQDFKTKMAAINKPAGGGGAPGGGFNITIGGVAP